MKIEPAYLGDGVYATHDGYHIWLAVNDHRNNVVALEPEVLRRLIDYATAVVLQQEEARRLFSLTKE